MGIQELQESGVRKSGVRSQESEVRSQKSGVRSQESGVRSQKSEVRSQESGVAGCSGGASPYREIFIAFRAINYQPHTGEPLSHSATPVAPDS